MFVALEFFRIGQLAAGGEHAILRLARGGLGSDQFGRGRRGGGDGASRSGASHAFGRLGDLQAGDEPFQISLLFGFEVASSRFASELKIVPGFRRHSAGTCVGDVSGAGDFAGRGVWVL